jgi:hypothetical protein
MGATTCIFKMTETRDTALRCQAPRLSGIYRPSIQVQPSTNPYSLPSFSYVLARLMAPKILELRLEVGEDHIISSCQAMVHSYVIRNHYFQQSFRDTEAEILLSHRKTSPKALSPWYHKPTAIWGPTLVYSRVSAFESRLESTCSWQSKARSHAIHKRQQEIHLTRLHALAT